MDENNICIKEINIDSKNIPEILDVPENSEYMIIRENGNTEVYDSEDEFACVFISLDNGICAKKEIRLNRN